MGFRLRVPHTLTLLSVMIFIALVLTWVVPQGNFERETRVTEEGQELEVVVPGTFELAAEREVLTPWDMFVAVPRAMAAAQDIIFFVLIIGGVLAVVRATGTVDALIGRMLERFGDKPGTLIFMVIFCFALASGSIGTAGEYIPFVLILVALCRAMRLDAMTAVAVTICGYGIGYGVAVFNPFTVVIAQSIAEVPIYSAAWFRAAILIPFVLIGVHHVYRYAMQVQADPNRSLVKGLEVPEQGEPPAEYPQLNLRHRLILLLFLATIGLTVWGIASQGWWLSEMGAAFLVFGVASAIVGRLGADDAAARFIQGAMELVTTALLVGFARCIALIMEDGQILDSIVHGLSQPLSHLWPQFSAVGMLIIQSILNLFIPSGSGQAFVTMPLMAPVGDLVGVSRQVAVLAYQFGDGFANMIVPTNAVLMGILGIAGVSYGAWFKFAFSLFLKLLAAAAVVLILAVTFGPVLPGF
ncbi:putative ion transporter superfamily protein YfcC [Natronospira proteinivora]|uniref:Ion transporter superfamily protein YfcC n=1 Tax=Natronospira proteinivora TaxID=1807133 RepID=A0ABT1GBU8_9GAMM|nr:TIGR00366 family protein [Natronospira proteinivora]MCP1727848.1 putative ion transporter superfamily protein YfcC [Natronospira proteinivora]